MELEAMYNHFLKGNSGWYGSLTGQPLSASPAQAETLNVHSKSNFSPREEVTKATLLTVLVAAALIYFHP